MSKSFLDIALILLACFLLAIPLGKYIAKIYSGDKTLWDKLFDPLDNLLYKAGGIHTGRQMNWKQHLKALLTINLLWFLWAMFVLSNQAWLPLNPDHIPSMSPHLAFNTAISFLVNCNLQHYSGETGLSYFSQISCVMFLQFVTAGTGMAAAAVVFKAMKERAGDQLGNFYWFLVRSCTRILLPLSVFAAIILVFSGTPMTWLGHATYTTLSGDSMHVARGPAAAMIAIKQLGTNGGGYFGTNSAHPFENPTYFTNILENIYVLLIPMAMVFALGYYLKRRRLSWVIFGVMTIGFLLLLIPTVISEVHGNPAIAKMGISQPMGNMEGKEMRFGPGASALWEISTTVTSNGSVNSAHDSSMPLSGMLAMMGMMINALYGGVGVGYLNFYVFIIIAVFISGLMVGRTPELLGKKIEAREMKIATVIVLLHPLLILGGAALATFLYHLHPDPGWLNNHGFHGFSEMLYEYTSASANNGSGFEGLGDNTAWWNISTGIVLILGRYLPIIGPVAIAGILGGKKYIPESAGTLKTDTLTFGIMVFTVIFIVAALSFFPALALGPIAEHFSLF